MAKPEARKSSSPPTALTKPVQKTQNLAKDEIPEYLRRKDGAPLAGTENMEREDMLLPRLGLCQSLSPQRKKQNPKYIQGLEEGEFFNTLTKQNYGPSLVLVPLYFYKTRIRFGDIEKGGGILCQARDNRHGQGDPGGDCARCPLQQFRDGEKPECNQFMNYAALVIPKDSKQAPGMDALLVASFKSTGLKIAREWNSLIRIKNLDAFAGFYEITSVEANNAAGQTWFQPKVEPAGIVPEHIYRFAQEAYLGVRDMQRAGNLAFDTEDLQREPGEDDAPVDDKDSEV